MLIFFFIFSLNIAHAQMGDCTSQPTSPAGEPCWRRSKNIVIGDTLYIEGRIDSMIYDLFKSEGLEHKIKRIELNSYGGDAGDFTYMAAEIIRKHGMITSVRKGARCASSCTLLYQAGVRRVAHLSSWFGYHGTGNPSGEMDYLFNCLGYGPAEGKLGSSEACALLKDAWYKACMDGTIALFGELVRYDAKSNLLTTYLQQPADENWLENRNILAIQNWVLSAKDSMAFNIVQFLEE